jgi:hypothetical protein
MSTKAKYTGGVLGYYESASLETVLPVGPVVFKDDFLGKAYDTTNIWTALDTSSAGDTTPALVADAPNGVLSCMLDATSEAQLSGIYWGDQRTLTLNQGLVFEARIKLAVLPTTGSIVCVGLMGDHNGTADTVAESIWFRWDGATGGLITVETDDTSNETSKVTTGVTLTNADWAILRVDCNSITGLLWYVNGVNVAASTTFDMSTVAALALQPVVRINKASGTSVGTIYVDYVRCWQKRS